MATRMSTRGCSDKERHGTRDEAKARAGTMRKRPNFNEVNVYWCRYCGYFHVGRRAIRRG